MASTKSQNKWRDKHRFVKSQLNVMARKHTHEELDKLASMFNLRGKGEAVNLASFMVEALVQRADYNSEAARMLDDFAEAYHRDRDIHQN